MTTIEQANAEALWPEGTDVDGLRCMVRGLLSAYAMQAAVYVGTANARGVFLEIYEDVKFWKGVSQVAPALRDNLRITDVASRVLDAQEKKVGEQ